MPSRGISMFINKPLTEEETRQIRADLLAGDTIRDIQKKHHRGYKPVEALRNQMCEADKIARIEGIRKRRKATPLRKRTSITADEEQQIFTKFEEGWNDTQVIKAFHRTWHTVKKLRARMDEFNKKSGAKKPIENRDRAWLYSEHADKEKIALANAALKNVTPDNDVEKAVLMIYNNLRQKLHDLKSCTINLETGECHMTFTTERRFKISA